MLRIIVDVNFHPERRLQAIHKGRNGAIPLTRHRARLALDEELHHDETLLGDLEVLGIDRGVVAERMPSPAVASLVGSQYYWLRHYHPLTFLGYVAVMEGYPPTPELIETLVERTGYPRTAFQTFAEHAELDPGHRDHLDRFVDSLTLTPAQEAVLAISAMTTAEFATRALEERLER